MVFTASLVGAWHLRDSVENKPASLLVAPLGKTLTGMSSSLHGKQVVSPGSLSVVVPSLTKDTQTEHELKRMNEVTVY